MSFILFRKEKVLFVFTTGRKNFSWRTGSSNIARRNWVDLKNELKLKELKIAYALQEHGCRIIKVEKYGFQGVGDGLVTEREGIALTIFTADCIPLLGYDTNNGILFAIHCGWRSLAAGILEKLLESSSRFHINPADTVVFIGPGICYRCYPVGRKLLRYFPEEYFFDNPLRLDLKRFIKDRLSLFGVKNIKDVNICTKCSNNLFSHRRGDKGRQANFVLLTKTSKS